MSKTIGSLSLLPRAPSFKVLEPTFTLSSQGSKSRVLRFQANRIDPDCSFQPFVTYTVTDAFRLFETFTDKYGRSFFTGPDSLSCLTMTELF